MNLLEIIQTRRSVRKYQAQDVEQEKLDYVIECARLAPSAVNFQPWQFYIVKSKEAKENLFKCYPNKWFSTHAAPIFIIACGDKNASWKRKSDGKDHLDIDIAIAFEHICLAAAEQGLGTCWVCNFDVEKVASLFGLPENMVPVAITPLGYPEDEEVNRTRRKITEEICTEI